jgi:alkyldihydroxyacetonephosphate synthase
MRRWNGWGDEKVKGTLPALAEAFLKLTIGESTPLQDIGFAELQSQVPASQVNEEPFLKTDAETRLLFSRGQSLPDLIALRSGKGIVSPDAVAFPDSTAAVQEILQFALKNDFVVIPYGGGTSVAGHINPPLDSPRPVITISLERLSELITLNADSLLAKFGAGIRGPQIEKILRRMGFTLGHYPQSFEYSTLGGWVATRSSGQQSLLYGRIESLFAGGTVVTCNGLINLPPFPASAAGPDLRQFFLGSEGRFGIISEVTVRLSLLPESERFEAAFFPSWQSAITALKTLVSLKLPLSMLRLSTTNETNTNLKLAGHDDLVSLLEAVLSLKGARDEKCMLIYGLTGSKKQVAQGKQFVVDVIEKNGGIAVLSLLGLGSSWAKKRFSAPYLRNTLWEKGYAVDTLETSTTWDKLDETLKAVEAALSRTLEKEKVHVFTHLSHIYSSGSSIYTTYIFRVGATSEETLERWQRLKKAASEAIVANGATISHQHGVGRDHAPYLAAEKGDLGMQAINALAQSFDPGKNLNPGVLLEDDG